jgi:hypothetical protein
MRKKFLRHWLTFCRRTMKYFQTWQNILSNINSGHFRKPGFLMWTFFCTNLLIISKTAIMHFLYVTRVARCFFTYQKTQFWCIWVPWPGKCWVVSLPDIFYGHLVNCWYVHLVYFGVNWYIFSPFWYVVLCKKNLATPCVTESTIFSNF